MFKWIPVIVFLVAIFCFSRLFFVRTAHADEPAGSPVIVFETNQGTVELELRPNAAPKTCENMIGLVQKGYYDGTVFHRVIKGFMF